MQNILPWSFYTTPLHPLTEFAHLLPHFFIKSMDKTLGNIGKGQKNRRFFRSGLEISWGWQWTFSIKTFKWNTFRLQRMKNTSFFTMSGKGSRSNMATLSTHNSKSWETYPISPVYNILQNASELEVDINIRGVSNMFNLDINPSMIGCQLPAFLGWQDVVDCPGLLRINESPWSFKLV